MSAGPLSRLSPAKLLTRRGLGFVLVALLCLAGAWILGRRDLLTLSVFLLALPVLAVLGVRNRHERFVVRREFHPLPVQEGTTTTVHLFISPSASAPAGSAHAGRRARWARLPGGGSMAESTMVEQLPADLGGSPRFRYPSRASRGGAVSAYEYRVAPPHRGVFPVGGVTAEFRDPFDLAWKRHTVDPGTELLVTPRPGELAPGLLDLVRGHAGIGVGGSQTTSWVASASENDVMVREYRHGDALRRVHWPSTARRGELMVRHEEGGALPRITLVLDQRTAVHSGGELAPFPVPGAAASLRTTVSFEWQLGTFLSVALGLAGLGHELRLQDHAGEPAFQRSRSAPHPGLEVMAAGEAPELLPECLAALELTEHPAPLALSGTGGLLVTFTGRLGLDDARRLVSGTLSGAGTAASWAGSRGAPQATVISCWPSSPDAEVRDLLETAGWRVLWASPGDSPARLLERWAGGGTATTVPAPGAGRTPGHGARYSAGNGAAHTAPGGDAA